MSRQRTANVESIPATESAPRAVGCLAVRSILTPSLLWLVAALVVMFETFGCARSAGSSAEPPFGITDIVEDADTAERGPRPAWRTASQAWKGPEPEGPYAYTDPGSLPVMLDPSGARLPLRSTDVRADLRGYVAEVFVEQRFHNDSDHAIEVVYTFPLPENAAVSDMTMTIGERVIRAEIMERDEARQTYEQARQEGFTSSLLEQERPNVFTQSVANIAPGEDIDVEIRYLQTLTYDSGEYEFVFPMVIGPRYIPGEPTGGGAAAGTGTVENTDQVPDASRISPPVVGEGTRTGNDITLRLTANAGQPILSYSAPTHEIEADSEGGELRVSLAPHERLPNRDFVLRYGVAGADPQATAYIGPADAKGNGHYMLVVHPPDLDVDAKVGRREFIFVVDRSGSMSGEPMQLAKRTVREMLTHLRPVDTFDIVGFESGTSRLFGAARPANASNLVEALAYLDNMYGSGGTEMADAVQAALSDSVAAGFNRYVFFLTDGHIGNEKAIFAGARRLTDRIFRAGQVARVFGVGIGRAPNRFLLHGLSRAGNGVTHFIHKPNDAGAVVNKIMHKVDHVVLTDLRLPKGPLRTEAYPSTLPDLFASQPLTVLGRYQGTPPTEVSLHAKANGRATRIPVRVQAADEDDRVLSTLWAREKVADLELSTWYEADSEIVEAITQIGLEHHIVTTYTSLVAVDYSRRVGDGMTRTVVMPSEMPEDREYDSGGGAGISLAGTTAAESKYTVEGANVNNPSFGTVGASVVQEFIDTSGGGMERGVAVAHVLVGKPSGTRLGRVLSRASKRALRKRLRRCVETSSIQDDHTMVRLVVEVRMSAAGELSVTIVSGTIDEADADDCVKAVVRSVSWSVEEGSAIRLPLRLWAR